ncbi:hypothetical protein [Photobacterium damselae]|uniref:hypothetical protein n=1 Tax=Photobacterium damselae TaxID=38293 RepID=UPI0040698B34
MSSITSRILAEHITLSIQEIDNDFVIYENEAPVIDQFNRKSDASAVLVGIISNTPQRYKPDVQSLTERDQAIYEYCISELDDAGVLPVEMEFNDELIDPDKLWLSIVDLGLHWLSEQVALFSGENL